MTAKDLGPSPLPRARTNGTNTVRTLFLLGAFVMLVTLPVVTNSLSIPIFIALLAILVVEFAAGFTGPHERRIAVANAVIAMVAVISFEYLAINASIYTPEAGALFWVNQILAINFFFAFYFACRTLRRVYMREKEKE